MQKRSHIYFLLVFLMFFALLVYPQEVKKDVESTSSGQQVAAQESKTDTDAKASAIDSSKEKDVEASKKSDAGGISLKCFSLNGKNRLVPEKDFSIQVLNEDCKDRIIGVYLHADAKMDLEKVDSMDADKLQKLDIIKIKAYFKQDGEIGKSEIIACLPAWQPTLKNLLKPKFFSGCFKANPAFLDIIYYVDAEKKKIAFEPPIAVAIPDPFWAWIWGIAAIFVSIGIAWMVLNKGKVKKDKIKFFKVPMRLIETPTNRYSLSLAQLSIWTVITLFGLVFVWKMTKSFMEITPQVLMLLGIGGGTAAFTRLQAASRLQNIPAKYQAILYSEAKLKGPKIADIISTTDGRPSLVKYQLITFTILIALIVFFEIGNNFSFPTLSDGLIALMGLSSAVYIGNDLSKTISENDLEKKLEDLDKYLKGKSDEEIKALVKSKDQNVVDFKDFVEKYLM